MTKRKYQSKAERGTNFQGHYQEGDFIEDLDCSYGQACNMLRKSWIKLKIAKKNDDELSLEEAKVTINRIQNILGLPITEWVEEYDRDNV